MDGKVAVGRRRKYRLRAVNESNKDRPVDGFPVWTSSDETFVRVTPEADSLSAWVEGVQETRDGQVITVTVTADARIGPDVNNIMGQLFVEVTPNDATTLVFEDTGEVEDVS